MSPAGDSNTPRLRLINTVLALVVLLLALQVARQEMRLSGIEAALDQARRDLTTRVELLALEKLRAQRADVVGAVAFVDDLYRAQEGLQRPGGLYNIDARQIDAEAIGTWVLDVYLQARIAGKSDAEARQSIADAIRGSDEWRRKHPAP